MARYFMAYFIWTSCLVAGQSPKYGLKGLEVNLKPDITGHPDDILWKQNGNKVVEFNGNEEQVYNSYKNRITLDWVSAELNITDLRFEDSGDYELEVYVNNLLHHSRFVLKVIDKVAKPNISCKMNDGSSSNISGKLLCSAEPRSPQSLMKFEWISHENVQLGPELIISLGNKHDDEVYSCRVSNHLSSETATFMAKDCYPDKSSLVVAVTVVAILLILPVICMAVFFYLRHRKGKSNDLENQSQHGSREGSVADKIKFFETERFKRVQPKHPDKKTDQEEEKRPLMNSDPASKHKEDGDSHQITVEPTEKNSPGSESSTDRKETESDGSKEEADENEEAQSAPASAETSTAQPCFPLTKSSPNMAPKDTAGEHKEESDSDQVTGETVRESDSSGIQQKINESDEEKQETSKPVSAENESDSVGDGEEKDKKQNMYLATSQQPQSPAPTKPDNRNTFQESPDTAYADPDREEEGKTRHDSDESEGQPNSSTEDADKGTVADKIKFFETERFKRVQPKHPDKKTDQEEEKRPLMNSDPASKHKEDGDSHQITVEPTEKNNPGSESSTDRKETESYGSKEEADEDEEAQSAPASAETSTAQPCFPLTKSSPNMAPKDTAGEHKEESDSDQVTGETVRESDSSGIQQKINESDEEKQETSKPVSAENESDSVGDGEEKDKKQNMYLATSQQPQSPAPTKPDNRNTFQESPDTAYADPDREEEGKTRHDSDESEGQPNSSTEDADKDKKTDQEEEKRPLMNSDPASKHKEDGDSHQITVEPTEKNSPGSESSTDRKETESDGSKEEADEDEEAQSAPASAETSTAQPCFPLTKSSPNMAPKDTAGEHKEESDSDQVTGETVRESDSSGIQQKINESDEEKQETSKPVSAENESDSVGDGEEKDKKQNMYLATSQQPQSPAPTKPDNRNTFQESPDTAYADPDQEEEGKTRHDSDESEGQPDSK